MLREIQSKLGQMSNQDLRALNKMVVSMLKTNSQIESLRMGSSLFEGQEVTIDHKKNAGKTFIIRKVNRTKCIIEDSENSRNKFNCPISMIII
jgi:hypothetical protein